MLIKRKELIRMTKAELVEAVKGMPDDCEIILPHINSNGYRTPTTVDCDGVHIYLEEETEVLL